MCFFVSSPNEEYYNEFIYGRIEPAGVTFDADKFKRLADYKANHNDRCRQCFAKWHCGGGCLYHSYAYSDAMHSEMCHFLRRFSLEALLEKVELNYTEVADEN